MDVTDHNTGSDKGNLLLILWELLVGSDRCQGPIYVYIERFLKRILLFMPEIIYFKNTPAPPPLKI